MTARLERNWRIGELDQFTNRSSTDDTEGGWHDGILRACRTLPRGKQMKCWSKRPLLAVAAGVVAWLTSAALTAGGPKYPVQSAGNSFSHSKQQRAPGALRSSINAALALA